MLEAGDTLVCVHPTLVTRIDTMLSRGLAWDGLAAPGALASVICLTGACRLRPIADRRSMLIVLLLPDTTLAICTLRSVLARAPHGWTRPAAISGARDGRA